MVRAILLTQCGRTGSRRSLTSSFGIARSSRLGAPPGIPLFATQPPRSAKSNSGLDSVLCFAVPKRRPRRSPTRRCGCKVKARLDDGSSPPTLRQLRTLQRPTCAKITTPTRPPSRVLTDTATQPHRRRRLSPHRLARASIHMPVRGEDRGHNYRGHNFIGHNYIVMYGRKIADWTPARRSVGRSSDCSYDVGNRSDTRTKATELFRAWALSSGSNSRECSLT